MATMVVESHSDYSGCGTIGTATWWCQNNQWVRAWVKEMKLKEENEIESNDERKWNQKQWSREQNRKQQDTKSKLKWDEIENKRWNWKRKGGKKQWDEIESKENGLHYQERWRYTHEGFIFLLLG